MSVRRAYEALIYERGYQAGAREVEDQARLTLAAIIIAAGGRVEVPLRTLEGVKGVVSIHDRYDDDVRVYTAR